MKNVIIVLTLIMTLTSCSVSRVKDYNYNPVAKNVSREGRSSEFYDCYKQASGQQSSGNMQGTQVNVYNANSPSHDLDKEMLENCMRARGYSLRGETTTETVTSWITSPITISLCLLIGKCNMDIY
jgi:hypothetical protein